MVSSPQHEPTMEEILASIRKIISEDSPEQAPAPVAENRPAPVPPPPLEPVEPESDVLELTQEVPDEIPVAAAPEPVRPIPPPPMPMPENDVMFETVEPAPVEAPVHSAEGIFSDKTRKSIDDAFDSIEEPEEEVRHDYAAAPLPVDGASVEAVFERAVHEAFEPVVKQWLGDNSGAIVERMKPLIREWMDEHFPALLEGAVRDEVARVARARGTKR
jgi:uncharacterized protein